MGTMRVVIVDSEERRSRLVSLLAKLPLKPVQQVTVEDYAPNRSSQQNRRYWLLLNEAAKKMGEYDADDLHEFFKQKFLGTRVVEIAGERATVQPSTRKLSTKRFRNYMDQVEGFLIEKLGVWLE